MASVEHLRSGSGTVAGLRGRLGATGATNLWRAKDAIAGAQSLTLGAAMPTASGFSAQDHSPWQAAEGGIRTGFVALDAALFHGGWPRAGLTELLCDTCGIGELRLLAPALKALCRDEARCIALVVPPRQERTEAGVRQSARLVSCTPAGLDHTRSGKHGPWGALVPYPPALEAIGVDLAKTLLIRPQDQREALWAMEQTLKTGACSAVLGWLAETSLGFANLRRLLLAARQGEAWGSLFRPAQAAESASAAELRLRLSPCPDDRLQVNIVKRRGGWPLSGIELDLAENEQTLHEGGVGTPALASFETPAAGLADASKRRFETQPDRPRT